MRFLLIIDIAEWGKEKLTMLQTGGPARQSWQERRGTGADHLWRLMNLNNDLGQCLNNGPKLL